MASQNIHILHSQVSVYSATGEYYKWDKASSANSCLYQRQQKLPLHYAAHFSVGGRTTACRDPSSDCKTPRNDSFHDQVHAQLLTTYSSS